ncbi:SAM-dependent methyltransferase [Oricola cellulosilytica]|uniref:Class I SAM-dependent methyltransferase n=1 Tax=Oricola cellulosilytica TaxID=1429082 RepID=A0A4R0PBW9_9HYPH|nr:cyclopropane-fatty-acyl-phospholipid synthase family protein [Oricola cellulosilytica]TCD13847.1 class I SAM-dependent methyltransferase [Oricola cellulosilytica]
MGRAGRLKSFVKLLAHMREVLQIDLGFILWDGVTVPHDLASDAFAVVIADEGAVAAMTRRPKMETLLNLWVARRVDLRNGGIFDLVKQKPKVRTRDIRRSANKLLAFNTARKFWFVDRGEPWPLETQPDEAPSDGSRAENEKNIQYHYDVSNAFYALFLDKEMVYTCAYCTDWDNDIDRMQADKLELICRKLRLKPGERMLDIGCGWGALSCYAAQNYGVSTLGVTLSTQQVEYANAKAKRLGIDDRVKFELADYATVQGTFDKVAAIGIQEHIGIDNYPTYYRTVKRVLKPDGLFLHHAITRPAKADAKANRRKNEEFALLTKYIFPGGELDNIGNTVMNLEQHGFEVHDVEDLREHYQRTCKHWHDRLVANYEAAVAEVGEVKTRLWLLYLGGCSIAFERNGVRLYQTLVSHKRRGPSGLPPTRGDLYR